jgi:hypothetical protein
MAKPGIRVSSLLAIVLVGASLAEPLTANDTLSGSWGGQSIALRIEGKEGKLEYDCANGVIEFPVHVDREGRFRARGTHSPIAGGPTVEGSEPQSYSATYLGVVQGDRLALRVHVPSLQMSLGPFSLKRSARALLVRCL